MFFNKIDWGNNGYFLLIVSFAKKKDDLNGIN